MTFPDAPRDLLQEAAEALTIAERYATEAAAEGWTFARRRAGKEDAAVFRGLIERLEAVRAEDAVWHDIRDAYLAILAAAPAVGEPETRGG